MIQDFTISAFSILKQLPDYNDFLQEKNGVLDGVFEYKTFQHIKYELFTFISKHYRFACIDPLRVDYDKLLSFIGEY